MKTLAVAIGVLALVLGPMMVFCGCVQAQNSIDAERTAVVLAAEAVHQADVLCADIGTKNKDAALLTTCRDAYNITRPAMVLAQYYFSTGDQKNLEVELCIGMKGLSTEADALVKAGANLPPVVTEALHLSGSICHA